MSRETNEELYVPYKKEDEELRGYAKFADKYGAPPLKNLIYTALITLGASIALVLLLMLTGLRLISSEGEEGNTNYFGWMGFDGSPVFGTICLPDGKTVTVIGDQAVYSDGSVYSGEMQGMHKNGYGQLIYPDGTSYTGQFKNDLYEGNGKLLFADGTNYEGAFAEGKYHGFGTIIYSDGSSYTGAFENGEMHGNGVMTYYDGSKYEGSFNTGMRDSGKYTWITGESIEGTFVNNMPNPNAFINYIDADGGTYYVRIKDGIITQRLSYDPNGSKPGEDQGGTEDGGEVVG